MQICQALPDFGCWRGVLGERGSNVKIRNGVESSVRGTLRRHGSPCGVEVVTQVWVELEPVVGATDELNCLLREMLALQVRALG